MVHTLAGGEPDLRQVTGFVAAHERGTRVRRRDAGRSTKAGWDKPGGQAK